MFRSITLLVSTVLALLVIHSALAQETIRIPFVSPGLSIYTPKCSDIDHDGIDENLYAPSQKGWVAGTEFPLIQAEYGMHPEDFKINYDFYPQGSIQSISLLSRVCLPVTYDKIWAQPGDANFNESLYVDFVGEVPGWKSNLVGYVSASALMTDTYQLVGFSPVVGLTTWLGSEVVGYMNWGDDVIAAVVKNIPGSVAASISSGLSWAFAIDQFYQVMSNASAGLPVQSVVFAEGSSMVTFADPTEIAYLRCYADVISEAGKYLVPNKQVMFLFDETTSNGCLVTGVPQGGIGDTPYKWEAILDAAMMLTLEKQFNDNSAAELIKAWEEYIEEGTKEVPPPFEKLGQSCPDLDVEGIFLKRHAVMASLGALNDMKRKMPVEEYGRLSRLKALVDRAMEVFMDQPFDAFYDSPRPRNEHRNYWGHFTHELNGADKYGDYWTAEGICFYNDVTGKWEWFLNRNLGRLRTGMTSTFYTGSPDFIKRRPYP